MNLIAPLLAQAATASEEPGLLFVPIMGICTVLLGLTCIILLCTLMSKVCRLLEKSETDKPSAPAQTASPAASAPIPNKGELVAAISAALAEELGTDISAIRIHSLRRVGAPAPAADPAHGELVAAISTALAEELGTDISAIRIHSLRKVG
ncbi:MAG: OadG family protein [Clostridia bacterium]|nr:OadG family protein [Clostridia bacterium]